MTPSVPPALDACFLGPYGENDTLLEKLVVEFLRSSGVHPQALEMPQ